jgi:hypothetical protein
MAIQEWPGFTGGWNSNRDKNVSGTDTLNLFVETTGDGSKVSGVLQTTPGFAPVKHLPANVNASYTSSWGEMFVITSDGWLRRSKNIQQDVWTQSVAIAAPNARLSMTDCQGYLFACDGKNLYMVSKDDLSFRKTLVPAEEASPYTAVNFYPKLVASIGTFLTVSGNTYTGSDSAQNGSKVYIMNPENMGRETIPWNDIAPYSFKGEIYDIFGYTGLLLILGASGVEAWTPTGETLNEDGTYTNNPLAYLSGSFSGSEGEIAPGQSATNNKLIFWLGDNGKGSIGAYATGLSTTMAPERVSIPAIEQAWLDLPDFNKATVETFSWNSHHFFVVKFAESQKSWAFDSDTGIWFRFQSLLEGNATLLAEWALSHVSAIGGAVYGFRGEWMYRLQEGLETYGSGESNPIRRLRVSPLLWNGNSRVILDLVQLDMQSGLADSMETPQTVRLRVSQDKGYTWGAYYEATLGTRGDYNYSAQFRRLGAGKQGMVIEASWNDRSGTHLSGAYYSARSGTKNA